MLDNDNFEHNLVLGREFLKDKISLRFKLGKENATNEFFFLDFVNTEICTVYEAEKRNLDLDNCEIDYEDRMKREIIKIISEIEDAPIPIINDNYNVRVHLRDESIYAYAPRRFVLEERRQIQEITEDLLRGKIIKASVSSYCAHIVPVRKKNGSMRLCVDLHPLNARVVKQKYPFPIIEDCIAQLGNKTVFTLLDLKDGFHQIDVHPADTKYFAFATPDCQYEYTKLPFGYCEASAEFQKRLISIPQPLVRENKVLVYIDDILILSETVQDNLETLKTLEILKSHNFELNLAKCQFLKKKIEYLGYIISADGITLIPRYGLNKKLFMAKKYT